jgi:acyl-CoA synthetase (AMP-forming)/AMP-acid ligase II
MKSDDPLLAAWDETLARKGDSPAIFDTRGQVLRTFKEIENRAGELEPTIAGSVYPIDVGNQPDWPSHLLAALRRGVVALPLESSITASQRESALQISSAGDWGEPQPVLLKLTSGTTAAPRAIQFRSEQLLADCTQICDTMGIGSDDVNFAVIPLSHSYGFSNLVTPLIARGVSMVLSRDRMPRAVLDDLARTGATVFPGMPVFYQAFCEMEKPPALPKLRLCTRSRAKVPGKIPTHDPFVLRILRMRRDLLRSRSAAGGTGFCRATDERCENRNARAKPFRQPDPDSKRSSR